MNYMPKLLFKYLPLDTIEYLRRVADIIENYRIYWPTRSELNDPMEGIYTRVLMGYAGNTFHGRLEQENPLLKERREKFRILSLSESCFIPQLWAYYAGNYTGICLCYRGDYNFQKAEKVQYKSCEGSPTCFAEEYTEEKIREDLLIKEENWKHEREWRIVEKGIQSFYYYGPEDLVAVILGWTEESEKDNPELEFKRKTIIKYLPENFPVYRIHMGRQSLKILLLENNYSITYDGARPHFIENVEDLTKDIDNKIF